MYRLIITSMWLREFGVVFSTLSSPMARELLIDFVITATLMYCKSGKFSVEKYLANTANFEGNR